MSIKTKVNGNWTEVSKAYVHTGSGFLQARAVFVKVDQNWVKSYEYEFVYTLASGAHDSIDLDDYTLDKFHNVRFIVPSDAQVIATNTSTPAIKTGTGYGGKLIIENHGKIYGRGGSGGDGGDSNSSTAYDGANGADGGNAILLECDLTVENNGTILGGGGGGGGGGGAHDYDSSSGDEHAGGGGGGGGAPFGFGGNRGSGSGVQATAGGFGNFETASSGGNGGFDDEGSVFSDGNAEGGDGGAGGAVGQAGSSGSTAVQGSTRKSGGTGGAAGQAYYNPNGFTLTQV